MRSLSGFFLGLVLLGFFGLLRFFLLRFFLLRFFLLGSSFLVLPSWVLLRVLPSWARRASSVLPSWARPASWDLREDFCGSGLSWASAGPPGAISEPPTTSIRDSQAATTLRIIETSAIGARPDGRIFRPFFSPRPFHLNERERGLPQVPSPVSLGKKARLRRSCGRGRMIPSGRSVRLLGGFLRRGSGRCRPKASGGVLGPGPPARGRSRASSAFSSATTRALPGSSIAFLSSRGSVLRSNSSQ